MDNEIFLIHESLCEPSFTIADKLLGREYLAFKLLTTPEQELCKLFGTSEIYKYLSGEKEEVSESQFNWITAPPIKKIKVDPYINLQGLPPAPANTSAQSSSLSQNHLLHQQSHTICEPASPSAIEHCISLNKQDNK